MVWAVPESTIQQINAAGKILAAPSDHDVRFDDWLDAYDVLNNWRAAHSYPLNTFQNNLRHSARRIDPEALIAQRIKRLASIKNKLRNHPKMKLSQMQDIAGCRSVLVDVEQVRQLSAHYEKKSRMKHQLAAKDNYIDEQKGSGYRGVHLIYRYFSNKDKTRIYNNMKIEMQLRSQFQHAWATGVETVGTFVGQALKSSVGDAEWRRFFALMGSAIAMREKSPIVPNTPALASELPAELRHLACLLNVQARLEAYGHALQSVRHIASRPAQKRHPQLLYYLLYLNITDKKLMITGYSSNHAAEEDYVRVEKQARNSPHLDAVLVSVDSLSSLQRAYPNYFADTRVFVELLSQELSGQQGLVQVPG